MLFAWLANLLAVCVQPIFVFDGPQRPRVKRGKAVIITDNWMVDEFKDLIHAFGFHSHVVSIELVSLHGCFRVSLVLFKQIKAQCSVPD